MADTDNEDNQELMHALESLRSLIDKSDDISSNLDSLSIPTLTPSEKPKAPQASLGKDLPLTVERQEIQLDIPELETLQEEQDLDPILETSFNEFWKILKPKLKQAARESYDELKAKKTRK